MAASSNCTKQQLVQTSSDLDADAEYSAEFLHDDDSLGNIDQFPEFDDNTELEPSHFSSELPAEERGKTEYTFDFRVTCYKKEFRGQHPDKGKTDAKVITREYHVFGDSPEEVLQQIWDAVKSHIRREVIVYNDQNLMRVEWGTDSVTEYRDIDKYVIFKDLQCKRIYRVSKLQEKSDVMVKWRGKIIDVYLHVYSLAVANQKLYNLVKRLEAPIDPDRSGACSNASFQDLIKELKVMHPGVSADSFVWNYWAEHVEAAPGYMRNDVKRNPPDNVRSYLSSAPNDDSVLLERNRRGLLLAETIVRAMEVNIELLREHSLELSTTARKIEERVSGMELQLRSYHEMLSSMQRSLAPVENDLSRELADSVTDAEDVNHM